MFTEISKNKLRFLTISALALFITMGGMGFAQYDNDYDRRYDDQYEEGNIDGPGVILYMHANFRGPSIFVPIGESIQNMKRIGWNDKISSIELVDGATIYIFQDAHYQGQSSKVKRNIRDLEAYSRNLYGTWNELISSVKVFQGRSYSRYDDDYNDKEEPGAIFWKHSNLRGNSFDGQLGGERNVSSFWNDEVSSVWVKRGYRLTIYEHDGFRGRRVQLKGKGREGTSYNLDHMDFNDTLSSYRLKQVDRSEYRKYNKYKKYGKKKYRKYKKYGKKKYRKYKRRD